MECPKCKSKTSVKDGIVKGRQRYLCKECKYRYTVEYRGKPNSLKKLALQLYLEGLGFRNISRILKVSNVSVLNWIKSFGKQIEEYKRVEGNLEIIEMDEWHTYIGEKKNYCWIWVSVDRIGRKFIDFTLGTRETETGIRLFAISIYPKQNGKIYDRLLEGIF